MFLRVVNPKGAVTVYNLDALGVYRISLACLGQELGIGIYYYTGGGDTPRLAMIAAIDLEVDHSNFKGILKKGLPYREREKNREVFAESMKVLHNVEDIKSKDADELIPRAVGLVDVWYKIYDALRAGADVYGEYESYRYCITKSPQWADEL